MLSQYQKRYFYMIIFILKNHTELFAQVQVFRYYFAANGDKKINNG